MPSISTCWSPCFWHMNVREGTYAVAFYTTFFPIVIIAYTAYVMRGGDSAQFYLPYFEADIKNTMQSVGAIAILFCLAFIICSFMLVQGVRKEYRGLFFPWMICMTLVVLFQAVYGLWIIIGYYILWNVFVSIVNWIWMAANMYFFLCVWSQYEIVTELQARHIELLYP
uniref:DUF7027 domain-containing protein n=1 Tax=Daphnia galeata TaxID=27404 RepID=A0A8J2RLD8_9CRUS|nr:unnamed protein product [Daphnia galeata]